MVRKLTHIRLRGTRYGLLDWDEHSYEDMVRQIRAYAKSLLDEAEAILRAGDADFDVRIVEGSHVQRFVRNVEPAMQPQEAPHD